MSKISRERLSRFAVIRRSVQEATRSIGRRWNFAGTLASCSDAPPCSEHFSVQTADRAKTSDINTNPIADQMTEQKVTSDRPKKPAMAQAGMGRFRFMYDLHTNLQIFTDQTFYTYRLRFWSKHRIILKLSIYPLFVLFPLFLHPSGISATFCKNYLYGSLIQIVR